MATRCVAAGASADQHCHVSTADRAALLWGCPGAAAAPEKPAGAAASRIAAFSGRRQPDLFERTTRLRTSLPQWSASRRYGSTTAGARACASGLRRGEQMFLRPRLRMRERPLSFWLARLKPVGRKLCAVQSVRWRLRRGGSSAARVGSASRRHAASGGGDTPRRRWRRQPGSAGQATSGAPTPLRQPAAARRARLRRRCARAAPPHRFQFLGPTRARSAHGRRACAHRRSPPARPYAAL